MDKSVDSIGSCSLDVDADSSDISDTSGSLNFPTPISIKDITQEFTANIHERCTVRKVHMQSISNPPTCTVTSPSALRQITKAAETDKKPSYLNLACCVNGYSNITTYDSKIRQDINKSREVSPIRPSTSSIQYCKKNDCLAPPSLQKMPNPNVNGSNVNAKQTSITSKLVYCQENGHQTISSSEQYSEGRQRSFIQQRVERLYGPGALAQGFYSQKNVRDTVRSSGLDQDRDLATSELTLKFKQLSPSKDYGEFRRKMNGTECQTSRTALENNVDNNSIDLPVLRHLSHEFRAQLPKISPKRNVIRSPPSENACPNAVVNNTKEAVRKLEAYTDEVDFKKLSPSILDIEINETVLNPELNHKRNSVEKVHHIEILQPNTSKSNSPHNSISQVQNEEHLKKDGNYFLILLKSEQDRLLSLACDAEKNIELLTGRPDVTEEIFGLLRSASGKARLLVCQKMKQFEGLCHKNLNDIPGQKFPTTADDLQGFWDMVNLQVEHIDSIFADLEVLKNNDWKKKEELAPVVSPKKTRPSSSRVPISKSNIVSNGNGTKSLSAAALKRESQRKQLMEIKRKNKIALAANAASSADNKSNIPETAEKNPIEIFINENQS